jgi:hypothetical protein
MHIAANPAGRLITFRIVPPVSDDNSERASLDLRALIVANPQPVVVISDLSIARAFSPETTARFVALMKSDNPKLFRAGTLISPEAPTLMLQIGRMMKEAGNPARRAFHDAKELMTWLDPDLTINERAALAAFFADH